MKGKTLQDRDKRLRILTFRRLKEAGCNIFRVMMVLDLATPGVIFGLLMAGVVGVAEV